MGKDTEISWCDHTYNPWWGCTNVSPGCDHCYAETFSHRLGKQIWGKDADRRFFGDKHWNEPLAWNKKAEAEGIRRRVFCGSMCDVMEDREDLRPHRERLYSLIDGTPSLDWLLLTKRPQNFRRFIPQRWLSFDVGIPTVWFMTTIESPAYVWRCDEIKALPGAVRGLSIEPLIAELPTLGEYLDGIDWCIVGGESGNGARPMNPDWARRIRDECQSRGIAFFMKQMGGVRDKRDSVEALPEDLRIREFPR